MGTRAALLDQTRLWSKLRLGAQGVRREYGETPRVLQTRHGISHTRHGKTTTLHLPTPELGRRLVQTTGPRDQILHASSSQQGPMRAPALYADVFRIGDDASPSKLRRLLRFRATADGTDAGYRCQRPATFLETLRLVEVRNPLLRDHVADVIAVDHHGGDRHARLLPNLHRIQRLDEHWCVSLRKSLDSLHHQFPAAGQGTWVCFEIQPGWARVAPAVGIVSHVRCTTVTGDPSCGHRR